MCTHAEIITANKSEFSDEIPQAILPYFLLLIQSSYPQLHDYTHQVLDLCPQYDVDPQVQEAVSIDGGLSHCPQTLIQSLSSCHHCVHLVSGCGGEIGGPVCVW